MTRRPLVLAIAVSALVAACHTTDATGASSAPSAMSSDTAATPGATGPGAPAPGAAASRALVVNDAAAANTELVESAVIVPAGFDAPARTLRMPPGVRVSLLAAGLPSPRFVAFDPAGNLLVGTRERAVYRYPAAAGSIAPAATPPTPLLTGLDAPTSVAFHGGWLYVGETTRVTRYRYNATGPLGAPEVIVPNLPAGDHNTRTVAFGPDGKLYVAVGSSCNICDESDERRAAVLRYKPAGRLVGRVRRRGGPALPHHGRLIARGRRGCGALSSDPLSWPAAPRGWSVTDFPPGHRPPTSTTS